MKFTDAIKGAMQVMAEQTGDYTPYLGKAALPSPNIIEIPYNTQRNNKANQNGQCNVTSLQMALSRGSNITDNELYEMCNTQEMKDWAWKNYPGKDMAKCIKNNNLNIVWPVLERVGGMVIGKQFVKYKEKQPIEVIKAEIDKGYCVVFGGAFTRAGHIVCAVGYTDLGLVCHDPFGVAPDYRDRDGAYVVYSYPYLAKIRSGRILMVHYDKQNPFS